MIPSHIQEKINEEVEIRYPDFKDTQQEIDFRNTAEFGFSLAESEIERLSKLLLSQLYSIWKGCDSHLNFDEWVRIFKQTNNL